MEVPGSLPFKTARRVITLSGRVRGRGLRSEDHRVCSHIEQQRIDLIVRNKGVRIKQILWRKPLC